MIRKFEYTDILGWSVSRYDTFSACKRQYYYQYYDKYDTEYHLLQIRTLKSLTSIPLEIGNITHKVIKTFLDRIRKTAKPIDQTRFMEYVEKTTAEIVASKNFTEIHYRERERIDTETDILPFVKKALDNFLKSERLAWLMREALAAKDQWIVDPDGYGECRIDKLKAYCKVDFMFPVGEDLHILDWKTGKEAKAAPGALHDKHSRQLRGYVAWAHFQFDKDYEHIKPTIAYLLPEYKERDVKLTEFDLEDFADKIHSETMEMYGYCDDVEMNRPNSKMEFPMTENRNICRFCNYRELCGR